MSEITNEQLIDIAISACCELQIPVPDSARQDFFWHFERDGRVSNLMQLTVRVCKRVDSILSEDDELNSLYAPILEASRDLIRWEVFFELNRPDLTLVEYLHSLPVGASWNIQKLRKWKMADMPKGETLFGYVRRLRGEFTITEVRLILGEQADYLLTLHPFIKENKTDWGQKERSVISAYLATLEDGEIWSGATLRAWSKDGFNLCQRVYRTRGAYDVVAFREILGEEADVILQRNPFEQTRENYTNEKIKETFNSFFRCLKSRKVRSWSPATLRRYRDNGVDVGSRLYKHLRRNYRTGDEIDWLSIFIHFIDIRDVRGFQFRNKKKKGLALGIKDFVVQKHFEGQRKFCKPSGISAYDVALDRVSLDNPLPDELIIEKEEAMERYKQIDRLREVIGGLPVSDRQKIECFVDGGDISGEDMGKIVEKLKAVMVSSENEKK